MRKDFDLIRYWLITLISSLIWRWNSIDCLKCIQCFNTGSSPEAAFHRELCLNGQTEPTVCPSPNDTNCVVNYWQNLASKKVTVLHRKCGTIQDIKSCSIFDVDSYSEQVSKLIKRRKKTSSSKRQFPEQLHNQDLENDRKSNTTNKFSRKNFVKVCSVDAKRCRDNFCREFATASNMGDFVTYRRVFDFYHLSTFIFYVYLSL
uniref:Uncharacterized protein n=1 Tax=Romanomermis culicivorax TaxID=13658 RepID=A0A915K135_ROMCU